MRAKAWICVKNKERVRGTKASLCKSAPIFWLEVEGNPGGQWCVRPIGRQNIGCQNLRTQTWEDLGTLSRGP